MRAAALALVLALTVATLFAVWPVVVDAPWEEADSRCEAALSLRERLLLYDPGRGVLTYQGAVNYLRQAEAEIEDFC